MVREAEVESPDDFAKGHGPPSRQEDVRRRRWPQQLVLAGATIAGLGVGNGVDNIVRFTHGADWTVSLGGLLLGLGVGPMIVGLLAFRRSLRPANISLVLVGSLLAGYSLGGGIDNFLRATRGEGQSMTAAAGLVGLGIGLAVLGSRRS